MPTLEEQPSLRRDERRARSTPLAAGSAEARSLLVAGGRRWVFTTLSSPDGALIRITDQDDPGEGIALFEEESRAFLAALLGLIRG